MEATALRSWMEAAAHGADHVEASCAAVTTMVEDPWRAAAFAGLLARCELQTTSEPIGLTAGLRVRSVVGASVVATVPARRPFPALVRPAVEPDRALAMRVADAARSVLARPVRSAIDVQCGVGTVLLALEAWGVPELIGVATSPLEAALAGVVVPRARIVGAARGTFDVVITRSGGDTDQYAAAGGAVALWMEEAAFGDDAGAAWRARWLREHALRGLSVVDGGSWIAGLAVGAGPGIVPEGTPWR